MNHGKLPGTYVGLVQEVERLRKISMRQSENLAAALKEKNDLAEKVTTTNITYYTQQIAELQGRLSAAQAQLRSVRSLAQRFFQELGITP